MMAGAAMPPWTAVGEENDLDHRVPAAQHGADVVPHRANRRGRDTDAAASAEWPFARLLEQALGRELPAESLVLGVEISGAHGRTDST